jgi:hypothetical protein
MKRITIEDMQNLAVERGGKCLSSTYKNWRIKLLWECAQGHRWEANLNSIQQGHWCPKCAINKRTKEKLN